MAQKPTPLRGRAGPQRWRPARRSASVTTLVLVGVVVALIVVLVVLILTPTSEPTAGDGTPPSRQYEPAEDAAPPAAALQAKEPGDASSGEPSGAASGAGARARLAPASTIVLPRVSLQAEAEQLQAEAQQVVDALLEQHPQLPRALHVAAMFNSQVRRSGEAERLWSKCIELDPTEVAYYVNLAAIAMDRGNSQLAADTLEQAIAAGLESPDVQHHLAVALTKLGRCEEAEEVIQKALQAHPQSASYWTVLGQAQLKQGKAADAETSLKRAIELGARTATVYFNLGNALARQQKREEAAEYREKFQALKDSSEQLDKQERYDVLSTAESRRTAITTFCEAAVVHRDQGNSLESERLLMRAIVLDPSSPVAYNLLAELYREANMLAEERVVRERIVELQPLGLLNYLLLAKLEMGLGEPEAAEATLKLALAMRPDAIEPYATLAEFYLERKKFGQARWYAQEAVRRDESAEGYRFLARVCRAMGDEATAQAALAKAETLQPAGKESP